MIRTTLAEARSAISRVAGKSGMVSTDTRIAELVNLAQQRLIDMGNWPCVVDRIRFCNYEGCVALPLTHETALKMAHDDNNAPIVNQWHEFLSYGPGQQDADEWSDNFFDRGLAPVIRQPSDQDVGQQVRIYGTVDERVASVRPTVRIFGVDGNNRRVRSYESGQWVDGELIEVNGDTASPNNYATSVNYFKSITQIAKPVLRGTIELFYLDSDGDTHFAGRYEPKVTNPSFRIYHWPLATTGVFTKITALCRKRFVPVVDETDLLIISNITALRHAVRAIAYEDRDEDDKAVVAWALAKQAMQDEATAYYGVRRPAIDLDPDTAGFAFDNIL